MAFDLPRDAVVPVLAAEIDLDPAPHPFEAANGAAIAENWVREKAAKPALFNGEVMLLSRLRYRGAMLEGSCHMVRYATFLLWRRSQPIGSAEHAYTHAMPVTSDNALILVRMGPHTANANRVYFAAGSFDPQDFPEGKADIDFNMMREVREETGIDLKGLRRDPHYHLRSTAGATVIFRRYFLGEPAEQVAERIKAFIAAEDDPEIVEPVIVRSPADLPDNLALHIPAIVEWHFANPVDGMAGA
ncbi:MAG TPA: NUDIX hydrolase [Rhizobiaceae bacterium]|nr:NUDIX hydrolase [Rhizobiaceae bacterium]